MELKNMLAHLRSHTADPNVTLTTNAGTSFADASLVREHLKKGLREAEELLKQHYDKRLVAAVVQRTRDLIATVKGVDSRPGIAIFANAGFGEVVHLPFVVQERVSVGSTFHLRDLLRAGLESMNYHVLLLGSDHARLFEAQDDHLVGELHGSFPLRNKHYTTDVNQVTTSRGQDNQAARFHKDVDAAIRAVLGRQDRVVVACVVEHYGHFIQEVNDRGAYIAHLKGSFEHVSPRAMVEQAWELVHTEQKQRILGELAHLSESALLMTNGMERIWSQVREGRGHVLFVERDLHQSAVLENDHAVLMDDRVDHEPGIDLVDSIIEEQMDHGGEIRIVPNGALDEYGGIALKPRY